MLNKNRSLFLFGKRGSGKDTVADHLVKNYGYERFSFGDKIRSIAKSFGIDDPKKEQLVAITNMGYQLLGPNVWINLAIRDLNEINKPIVITDMRYPDIYKYFLFKRRFFPVGVVSQDKDNYNRVIKRDGRFPDKLTNEKSEKNLEGFVGYPIFNFSTISDLNEEVDNLIDLISDDKEFNSRLERYIKQYKILGA